MKKRDHLLKMLLRESHKRQFNGEDYQEATFEMFQKHNLTDDEVRYVQSSPDPGCDCGFCASAEWID